MCGADPQWGLTVAVRPGSSPRVRSRQEQTLSFVKRERIISACAEQTARHLRQRVSLWDHLRVCGADQGHSVSEITRMGSSPRVRSRLTQFGKLIGYGRIISACAEQTPDFRVAPFASGDHLRVCGADYRPKHWKRYFEGSSPRVRSRHVEKVQADTQKGIISACAEQTGSGAFRRQRMRDHLRVCGADQAAASASAAQTGSSPRVRSRPDRHRQQGCRSGIISACAEQTVVFYCGLGWSGVAEYLIHALRGVGKRRGCQYLE